MTSRAEHVKAVIAEYRAAYLAANGSIAPVIRYETGWCVFLGWPKIRHRLKELERMARVFRGREAVKGREES